MTKVRWYNIQASDTKLFKRRIMTTKPKDHSDIAFNRIQKISKPTKCPLLLYLFWNCMDCFYLVWQATTMKNCRNKNRVRVSQGHPVWCLDFNKTIPRSGNLWHRRSVKTGKKKSGGILNATTILSLSLLFTLSWIVQGTIKKHKPLVADITSSQVITTVHETNQSKIYYYKNTFRLLTRKENNI